VPFDRVRKNYNQAKKTRAAGFDVVMNLHKAQSPAGRILAGSAEDIDEIVLEEIRRRAAGDPDTPRTPQYLRSPAVSTLLERGVAVEKIAVCDIIGLCEKHLGAPSTALPR